MRTIEGKLITQAVKEMAIETNYKLSPDVYDSLRDALKSEKSPIGRMIIGDLVKNADIAGKGDYPICQDTGMAIVFVELGQDVRIDGGYLEELINEGVRKGYEEGFLRKSIVANPLIRKNTGDNTPAVIHTQIVMGEKLKIGFSPKGFGSENMSQIKMLNPSDGEKGVIDFVVKTVSSAGSNPCPPVVVGVGIGGSFEKAALMAKKALFREIESSNEDEYMKILEDKLLREINSLGVGPQGLGGTITALGVNVEFYPTHIAGLPVAVNISCHATRHMSIEI